MKLAALVTFLVALALFATMGWVQHQSQLEAFRFGTAWTFPEKQLRDNTGLDKDQSKPLLVVIPLLFPLDFLFLIFFGLFLALCSVAHADMLWVRPPHTWLLLILPVAYMVADFSENVLYTGMLLRSELITPLIDAAHWATRLKLILGTAAFWQAVIGLVRSWL
jgi:hypothetical protein